MLAGFKLLPSELQLVAQQAKDDPKHTKTLDIVTRYAVNGKQNQACPTGDGALAFYDSFSDQGFAMVRKVCGNNKNYDCIAINSRRV